MIAARLPVDARREYNSVTYYLVIDVSEVVMVPPLFKVTQGLLETQKQNKKGLSCE